MLGELALNEAEEKEFFYNLNGLFSAFIPNIPAFQHSSIPFRRHKQVAIKRLLISYSYRTFKTKLYRQNSF